MQIVHLTPSHEALYFKCLEPWSEEMDEAGDAKARWYERFRDKGLIVRLAIDDDGEVAGMIQALPVEQTWVDGTDLAFVLCTWVHGYEQGIGDRQGRGLGSALLGAVEAEAARRGYKGVAAWGLAVPVWMKAAWYKRHGYKPVDRDGVALLLWKPFAPGATRPRWMKRKQLPPARQADEPVTVRSFHSGWCPAQSITANRAACACAGFGPEVSFEQIDTADLEVMREWGIVDGLFIDDHEVRTGPPPDQATIEHKIERAVHPPVWRRWVRD